MSYSMNRKTGATDYRPSWFVLLAAAGFVFSTLRVSLGADLVGLIFPATVLVVTILLDRAIQRR